MPGSTYTVQYVLNSAGRQARVSRRVLVEGGCPLGEVLCGQGVASTCSGTLVMYDARPSTTMSSIGLNSVQRRAQIAPALANVVAPCLTWLRAVDGMCLASLLSSNTTSVAAIWAPVMSGNDGPLTLADAQKPPLPVSASAEGQRASAESGVCGVGEVQCGKEASGPCSGGVRRLGRGHTKESTRASSH